MEQLHFRILPGSRPGLDVPAGAVPAATRESLWVQVRAQSGPVPTSYAEAEAGWRYELHPRAQSALLMLWRGPQLLAVAGIALGPAEAGPVWEQVEQYWLTIYEAGVRQLGHDLPATLATLPAPPARAPWAALVVLPVPGEHLRQAKWLVRFALDMAWAFSDVVARRPQPYPPAA